MGRSVERRPRTGRELLEHGDPEFQLFKIFKMRNRMPGSNVKNPIGTSFTTVLGHKIISKDNRRLRFLNLSWSGIPTSEPS